MPAAVVAGVVWWHTPSLLIETTGGAAVARLQSVEGGPADLRYLTLDLAGQDESIWRVIARQGSFQVHNITFTVGSNPSTLHIDGGRAWTVTPDSAPTFMLSPGTEYRLHICPGSILGLCRTERFTLAS